jgi:peptide/nickel transport system substrate-binding protein
MNKFLKRAALGALAAAFISGSVLADTVTLGVRTEPSSIDPHFHNLGPNNAMLGQIFGRLIEWSPDMRTLIPRLATSWKAINDNTWATRKGLTYTARADERTVGINLVKDN